jgi:quinol monooxygenase YgiN
MADHAHVVRTITVRPSASEEALLAALRKQAEYLSNVDGCFGAQVTRPREEPASLTVIVRWASDQALQQYLQSEQFNQATEELLQLVAGPPEIRTYDSV